MRNYKDYIKTKFNVEFVDKRIQVCLNLASKIPSAKKEIKKMFSLLPKEAINAINDNVDYFENINGADIGITISKPYFSFDNIDYDYNYAKKPIINNKADLFKYLGKTSLSSIAIPAEINICWEKDYEIYEFTINHKMFCKDMILNYESTDPFFTYDYTKLNTKKKFVIDTKKEICNNYGIANSLFFVNYHEITKKQTFGNHLYWPKFGIKNIKKQLENLKTYEEYLQDDVDEFFANLEQEKELKLQETKTQENESKQKISTKKSLTLTSDKTNNNDKTM